MKRFKNILAAVDLHAGNRSELAPPSVEAVERALWLAKLNSASLTFFHALDDSIASHGAIQGGEAGKDAVHQQAQEALAELVEKSVSAGVDANMQVCLGRDWLEIIRQVLRSNHDLVVAGTRRLGALQGILVGSTGIKLLRKCPCPVWITQPQTEPKIKSVLVAHCLRTVGDLAMELGCSMAQLHDAQLHVFHSLEFPELESTFPARVSAEKSAKYRANAERHIQAQLEQYHFTNAPRVKIDTDAPDFAILREIEEHDVELVVMGTVARTGVAGFITGNTAERLLPRLPCSVLAVKPPGFLSPVMA